MLYYVMLHYVQLVLMLGLYGCEEEEDDRDIHTNSSSNSNSNRGRISFRLRQPTHITDRAAPSAVHTHSATLHTAARSSSCRDRNRDTGRSHTHAQRLADKRPTDFRRWELSDDGEGEGEGGGGDLLHSNSLSPRSPPSPMSSIAGGEGVGGGGAGSSSFQSSRRRRIFKPHNGSDSEENSIKLEIATATVMGNGKERESLSRGRGNGGGLPPRNPAMRPI